MEEIVQKLNLQSNESNNITIYTSKPKEIMSPVVTLVIKSKDENTIIVKANSIEQPIFNPKMIQIS